MPDLQRTHRTYVFECSRAVSTGIMEAAGSTFLLLLVVVWFQSGFLSKALVAGAGSLGLMLSPAVVAWASSNGKPISHTAARLMAAGSLSFLLTALWLSIPVLLGTYVEETPLLNSWVQGRLGLLVFVPCSVVGMAAPSAVIPLLTQMYQENYPEAERGRRFSRTVMIRIATTAGFSKLAGDALDGHMECFPLLLLVFAAATAFSSYCLQQCPTSPIAAPDRQHVLRAMRFVREDRLFRRTLICWMLMGFANLMMLPLRVEYLANPKYNLALSVGMIALLTGVIPNLARLALSPLWGYLFDHMNFFALRVTLNVGFALGILAFFTSNSLGGMIAGAVVYGISHAGGDVAWSLWVTKFAPPERVADYMAVHTFLTGVRGVLAPMCAFLAVNHLSLGMLALISAVLIGSATILLLPEIGTVRKARSSGALVEEVSD